ncbi:hypothetical protein [Cytobacillus oceanisediminis]|nr:hypothetical protein [Cytobacillus oceanisediminis]
MFLVPNSKACAEMFGEGPDADSDKCEVCINFFLEDNKRCCKREPLKFVAGGLVKSKFIEDGVTCCGSFSKATK